MTKLKMLNSYKEENDLLEHYIKAQFDGKSELEILEAGCGRNWPLRLNEIKYKLTGVDLDQEALRYRISVTEDLDEAILGDLRIVDLGTRKFDVIYNSFVLEHVDSAALVLENFSHWLKPGGLLILKMPDRHTVFGFITNITPFWFHVAYYKYILGRKNAGKPGFGPYPTYYDRIVSRHGIQGFCKSHNFTISEERGLCTYGLENSMRTQLVRIIAFAVSAFSFGSLPWKHNNLTYVIKKEKVPNGQE